MSEKKITKNIITRESIEKTLKESNKLCMRMDVMMLGIPSVVCLPVSLLLFSIVDIYPDGMIFFPILHILIAVSMLGPIIYWAVPVIQDIRNMILLKHEEFSIVVDEVAYKAEEPHGKSVAQFFYFHRYGRVYAGDVAYQLSSNEDAFYLVVYHTKKPKVVIAYSQKMYEFQGTLDQA